MKENPILQQRIIEANVIQAFYRILAKEYGAERSRELISTVIREMAFEKGRQLRKMHPDGDLSALVSLWANLGNGGGLDIEFIRQSPECLHFRVTRCGYAEAYREMGFGAELGDLLSCSRDEPLLKGFSDNITLERSRTIMDGSKYCELIYRVKK